MKTSGRVVIVAENLAKQYRIGETASSYDTLADALRRRFGRRPASKAVAGPRQIWALRDVSFEVREGEIVGIIGRNGAGKSTLLKILSRITAPTRGRATIQGRVGSLLEVGTGFQPELTGRENVFLNGAILGMSRGEIARKFDEIVAFSEIGDFIDTPVKRYSSGMHSRLAFAVAAHLEPEIMIVDEVLSVGDLAFQKKCLNKMQAFMQGGRTVLFVSHSMGSVAELCGSAILLDRGAIVRAGSVPEVIDAYLSLLNMDRPQEGLGQLSDTDCVISSVDIQTASGSSSRIFNLADPITIQLRYRLTRELYGFQISLSLSRNLAEVLRTFDTDGGEALQLRPAGEYLCRHVLPARFLKAGGYSLAISVGTQERQIFNLENVVTFQIEELTENTRFRGYFGTRPGHVISPGKWSTERVDHKAHRSSERSSAA